MFAEELTKIQDCERQAEEILKKAKLDSKQALDDARAEAAKLIEDAETKGKEIYDAFLKEGQEESARQYDNFLAKTRQDCDAAMKAAAEKQDDAIAWIAERIVGASVNH